MEPIVCLTLQAPAFQSVRIVQQAATSIPTPAGVEGVEVGVVRPARKMYALHALMVFTLCSPVVRPALHPVELA